MTSLGYGICWVGGTFNKSEFKVSDQEELICVIVMGKVQKNSIKEKMIRATISKNRKSVEERIVSDTEEIPHWITEGIEAVRLAPSAKNSQKPLFKYEKGILSCEVSDEYEFDLVDLGIAKKHFELVTNGTFDIGNGGIFHKKNGD